LYQRDFDKAFKYIEKSLRIREVLFKEKPTQHKIDYVMSLYNKAVSLQQLVKRKEYISALELFIEYFEKLEIKEVKAIGYYTDAKNRLQFATSDAYAKLRPLDEIKAKLPEFIRKHKDSEPSPEKANEIIKEFRNICGGSIIISQTRDDLEQFYFRVRNKSSMNEGDEKQPSQLSYPPAKYAGFGRVNLSKYPVFYGGEKISVVIKETHIKEGDEFYLSCWRSNKFYPKYALMHSNSNNSNRMNMHKEARKQHMTDGLKALPNLAAESFEYIFESLSELFTIDDWTISSAIGYNLLYENSDIDGIEYPDVKTKSSYNFALKPEAADKLSLINVYYCKLRNGQVAFIETGIVDEGIIKYQKYQEEDHPLNKEGIRVIKESDIVR